MHSEHLTEPKVMQHHLTQSIFYNKESTTSCNLSNTVMKVTHGMTVWVQNGCMSVVDPHDLWLTGSCHHMASLERTGRAAPFVSTAWEKNPHSKFLVWNLLNADHLGTIMKHKNLSWTIISQGLSVIKLDNLIPKGPSLTNILLEKKKAFAVEHKSSPKKT